MTTRFDVGTQLVLSIFPGLDLLGHAFEQEGFSVVRGPDVILGGDIRAFHPPPDRFDGVIGGDPCQSHSALANLMRAKGLEPSFPDMTPEFARVVEEARPAWFLRENVPKAPYIKPAGYDVRSFLLDHSTLNSGDGTGHEQRRRRRFWFGTRDVPCPELRRYIDFAWFVLPDRAVAVGTGHDYIDGEGPLRRVRRTATAMDGRHGHRSASVTGRHPGEIGLTGGHRGHAPRYTLAEMLRLQGLPEDFLDHSPFTVQGKRKAVGNGVPVPMARALARAVVECGVGGG